MPCRDYESDRVQYVQDPQTKRRLDQRSAQLCEACRVLEQSDLLHRLSLTTRDWWARHKAEDEARIRAERKAREERALADKGRSKLTSEELKALKKFGL